MAVPTSKRKTSAMQYVETLRKLSRDILQFTNRLPKRYAQRLSNPMCNHATEALYEVQAANRIFITCEEEFQRRKAHLQEAEGHIDHVSTLLDMAYDIQENPNENVYEAFGDTIDKERKLIAGVKKKDREHKSTWQMTEGEAEGKG